MTTAQRVQRHRKNQAAEIVRLRCALADIEALAETLAEAKAMAAAALEAPPR